jgi:hypothetical protein
MYSPNPNLGLDISILDKLRFIFLATNILPFALFTKTITQHNSLAHILTFTSYSAYCYYLAEIELSNLFYPPLTTTTTSSLFL